MNRRDRTRWLVCGSYREFREWRREHFWISSEKCILVQRDQDVWGRSGDIHIVILGSFENLNRYRKIDILYALNDMRHRPDSEPFRSRGYEYWSW